MLLVRWCTSIERIIFATYGVTSTGCKIELSYAFSNVSISEVSLHNNDSLVDTESSLTTTISKEVKIERSEFWR